MLEEIYTKDAILNMKIRAINQYWSSYPVRRGFDQVCKIYEAIDGHGWIAGSYAAFMANPNDTPMIPGDIDVFARSKEDARMIVDNIEPRKRRGRFSVDENETAFTIHRNGTELSIQVVKPSPTWANFPWCILDNFDFDVSRAVLITPNKVIADHNVGCHDAKVLRVNNPLRSLKRVLKYHDRGIEFNDHELLKLFQAWDQLQPQRKSEMIEAARREVEPEFDSGFWLDDDDSFDGE